MSLDTDCYMSVGVSALWVLPRGWEFADEFVACLLHVVPNSLGVLLIHRCLWEFQVGDLIIY